MNTEKAKEKLRLNPLLVFPYLAGIALSKGFWWTALAISFPPWAWYVAVERALTAAGWL